MIAILVLIVSLNAIQCQDFCHLMKTDGKDKGIHVYHSTVDKAYVMYKNGIQWQFHFVGDGVLEMKSNTNRSIDTAIVNRFGGSDYDCNVTQKSNQTVTKCTVGGEDTVSQYDPKAFIFRASEELNNDWVVIYSKNGSKIWCYSPKVKSFSDRLVKDTKECKQKMGMKATDRLFLESMDRTIVAKIDGLVDFISGGYIDGHYVFINEKSTPRFCAQHLSDTEIECNSTENYIRILKDCFDGSEPQPQPGTGLPWWGWLIIGIILVIIGVGIYYCYKTGTFKTIKGLLIKPKADDPLELQQQKEEEVDTTSTKPNVSPLKPLPVTKGTQAVRKTGVKKPDTQTRDSQKQVIDDTPSAPPKVLPSKSQALTTRPKTAPQTGAKPRLPRQKPGPQPQPTTALKSVSPGAAAPPSTPGPSHSAGANAGPSAPQPPVGDVQPSATIDVISQPGQQPRHVVTITTPNPQTGRRESQIWDIDLPANDNRVQNLNKLVKDVEVVDQLIDESKERDVELHGDLQRAGLEDKPAIETQMSVRFDGFMLLCERLDGLLESIRTLLRECDAIRRPQQPLNFTRQSHT